MLDSSDDLVPIRLRPPDAVATVRLVGDADAVEWVSLNLAAQGFGVELVESPEHAGNGSRRGPVVWVARPSEADEGPAVGDAAVWSFPCLIVIPPGGATPDLLAGHPSVESFELVREPEDAPLLRMRLERLLLLHRRRTQTEVLLHNLPDVVYTRTLDGVLTSVNAAGARLAGRRREAMIGNPVSALVPEGDAFATLTEQAAADPDHQLRHRARLSFADREGRKRLFDAEAFLLRDGRDRAAGIEVVLSDVTDETEARERLKTQADRNGILATIAAAARDAVDLRAVLDITTSLLGSRLGARACAVWLADGEHASFRLESFWRSGPPVPDLRGSERSTAPAAPILALRRSSRFAAVPDEAALGPDDGIGRLIRETVSRSAIGITLEHDTEVIGVLGLTFAEPRGFPEEMSSFLEQVADQVALGIRAVRLTLSLEAKIAALAEAQRRRDEADRGRQQLTSMLVHDLKNPLSAVIASVELAMERIPEDVRLERMLRNSLASALSLQGLIEDALLVYRPSDSAEPERIPQNPNETLVPTLEEARWLAEARKVELDVHLAVEAPRVRLEASQFRRAAANLIGNAIKFSHRGGKVVVSTHYRDVPAGRCFVLEVADSGPGVPPELRERLATPYLRFAGSESVPGTGLGLTVVQRVAQAHGGCLNAEARTDGPGAVFTLWVPL